MRGARGGYKSDNYERKPFFRILIKITSSPIIIFGISIEGFTVLVGVCSYSKFSTKNSSYPTLPVPTPHPSH